MRNEFFGTSAWLADDVDLLIFAGYARNTSLRSYRGGQRRDDRLNAGYAVFTYAIVKVFQTFRYQTSVVRSRDSPTRTPDVLRGLL